MSGFVAYVNSAISANWDDANNTESDTLIDAYRVTMLTELLQKVDVKNSAEQDLELVINMKYMFKRITSRPNSEQSIEHLLEMGAERKIACTLRKYVGRDDVYSRLILKGGLEIFKDYMMAIRRNCSLKKCSNEAFTSFLM